MATELAARGMQAATEQFMEKLVRRLALDCGLRVDALRFDLSRVREAAVSAIPVNSEDMEVVKDECIISLARFDQMLGSIVDTTASRGTAN
jgi:hypothetical protein